MTAFRAFRAFRAFLCLSVVMERVAQTWRRAEWEAYECIGLADCFLARIGAYRMLKLLLESSKMYDCADFRKTCRYVNI